MTKPFFQRIEKPWGHEILWTPPGLARAGKFLWVRAGCRLSLQFHDQKEETLCLLSGEALLWLENSAGGIEKIPMIPEQGYTIALLQKHRIEAVADSFFAEVSDPEKGNTVRLEDDYSRGTETESARNSDRQKSLDESN